MNKLLTDFIDRYKNGLLETEKLQIINEEFSTETVSDEHLYRSYFDDLSFTNLNFTNVNFNSSFFRKCLFKNCTFEDTSFSDANFENCILINCQIKDSEFGKADFTETSFNKCCFERVEKGGLVKVWFESCKFLDTDFKGFEGLPLIQATVVDCKFFKFNKSIEFKGEFFLMDILNSGNGINEMFIE